LLLIFRGLAVDVTGRMNVLAELSKALEESPSDPGAAFTGYQAAHGKRVAVKQKTLGLMAARLVPKTSTGIWLSTHIFWKAMAGLAAGVRLRRKLRAK
jgi:hypothetical protein